MQDETLTEKEKWAEVQAKMFERRAESVEALLTDWEKKKYPDAYVACLKITLKAEAYRELANELRRSYYLRVEQEAYEKEGRR